MVGNHGLRSGSSGNLSLRYFYVEEIDWALVDARYIKQCACLRWCNRTDVFSDGVQSWKGQEDGESQLSCCKYKHFCL